MKLFCPDCKMQVVAALRDNGQRNCHECDRVLREPHPVSDELPSKQIEKKIQSSELVLTTPHALRTWIQQRMRMIGDQARTEKPTPVNKARRAGILYGLEEAMRGIDSLIAYKDPKED